MRTIVSQLLSTPRALLERTARVVGVGSTPASDLKVDVYATQEEVVVVASIPGLKPEDVEIKIEDDRLTICGKYPLSVANVRYVMQERERGYFSRTLVLNVPVDAHRANARIKDGALILALPKTQVSSPNVVRVPAKAKN